jgi:histone H3/H4
MTREYARALASSAVAQTLIKHSESEAIQQSAHDVLIDVLIAYIEALGRGARDYAEESGRNDVNLRDVLRAHADKHPDAECGSLEALFRFISDESHDWPMSGSAAARESPAFPVPAPPRAAENLGDAGAAATIASMPEAVRPASAHRHLPAFPPAHTWQHTPVPAVGRETDAKRVRRQQLRQDRLVQRNLCDLRERQGAGSHGGGRDGPSGSGEGKLWGSLRSGSGGSGMDLDGSAEPRAGGHVDGVAGRLGGPQDREGGGGSATLNPFTTGADAFGNFEELQTAVGTGGTTAW